MERIKTAVARARREQETTAPPSSSGLVGDAPGQPQRLSGGTLGRAIGALVGLAGLLAGGAALWLTLGLRVDLERQAAVPPRPPETVTAPAPDGHDEAIRALTARLDLFQERIAALETDRRDGDRAGAMAVALGRRVARLEAEVEALSALAATESPPAESTGMVVTLSATPSHGDAVPSPAVAPPERKPAAADAEPPPTPPPALAAEPATAPADPRKKAAQPAATAAARTASRSGKEPLPMPDGGPWVVVVQSFDSEAAAERRRTEAVRLGIPAEVHEAQVKGQLWHRVVVPGYSSQQSAQTAATEFGRRRLGTPWILLTRTPD
jgi:hypothetical protein